MKVKSKVSQNFQTAVPREIRWQLGLKPGDYLEWERGDSGSVVVRKVTRLSAEYDVSMEKAEEAT